jgi:hypothetical protein
LFFNRPGRREAAGSSALSGLTLSEKGFCRKAQICDGLTVQAVGIVCSADFKADIRRRSI